MRFQVDGTKCAEYKSAPGKKYQIFRRPESRRTRFISAGYAVDELERDRMLRDIENEGDMALWAYCAKIHWPGYKRPAPFRQVADTPASGKVWLEDLDGVKYLDEIFS